MANIWDYEVRKQIYQKYDGKCAYCGYSLDGDYTIDHIEAPRRYETAVRWQLEVLENYNPCCRSCNSSKSYYDLDEWRERLEYKKKRAYDESAHVRILSRFGVLKISPDPVVFYFEKVESATKDIQTNPDSE